MPPCGGTLSGMSLRTRLIRPVVTLGVLCAIGVQVAPAAAAPTQGQVAADRAALESAVARYEEAQAESTAIETRLAEASAGLDAAVAEEQLRQSLLSARVVSMYRSGEEAMLLLLFGASSIQDLEVRLDILARLARQDASNLEALKAARAEAEETARRLMEMQAEQARAMDTLAAEVAAARAQLEKSQAALEEYEARVRAAEEAARAAAAEARAKAAAQSTPSQDVSGSGEWRTAVASHYSATFTGRGASGEEIGPYTMMVAHKTLPFGTLVEFEYKGKRAVASVEDRGPYVPGREWDLGPGVVRALDFNGVHEVRYRIVSQ